MRDTEGETRGRERRSPVGVAEFFEKAAIQPAHRVANNQGPSIQSLSPSGYAILAHRGESTAKAFLPWIAVISYIGTIDMNLRDCCEPDGGISTILRAGTHIVEKSRQTLLAEEQWSVADLGLSEGDSEWLRAWAAALRSQEALECLAGSGELSTYLHVLLLAYWTEENYRSGSGDDVWPSIENSLLGASVKTALGVTEQDPLRRSLRSCLADAELGLSNVYGLARLQQGQPIQFQSTYTTVCLQHAFTRQAAHTQLSLWLDNQQLPIAIQLLLGQSRLPYTTRLRSASFSAFWEALRNLKRGRNENDSWATVFESNWYRPATLPDIERIALRRAWPVRPSPRSSTEKWTSHFLRTVTWPQSGPEFSLEIDHSSPHVETWPDAVEVEFAGKTRSFIRGPSGRYASVDGQAQIREPLRVLTASAIVRSVDGQMLVTEDVATLNADEPLHIWRLDGGRKLQNPWKTPLSTNRGYIVALGLDLEFNCSVQPTLNVSFGFRIFMLRPGWPDSLKIVDESGDTALPLGGQGEPLIDSEDVELEIDNPKTAYRFGDWIDFRVRLPSNVSLVKARFSADGSPLTGQNGHIRGVLPPHRTPRCSLVLHISDGSASRSVVASVLVPVLAAFCYKGDELPWPPPRASTLDIGVDPGFKLFILIPPSSPDPVLFDGLNRIRQVRPPVGRTTHHRICSITTGFEAKGGELCLFGSYVAQRSRVVLATALTCSGWIRSVEADESEVRVTLSHAIKVGNDDSVEVLFPGLRSLLRAGSELESSEVGCFAVRHHMESDAVAVTIRRASGSWVGTWLSSDAPSLLEQDLNSSPLRGLRLLGAFEAPIFGPPLSTLVSRTVRMQLQEILRGSLELEESVLRFMPVGASEIDTGCARRILQLFSSSTCTAFQAFKALSSGNPLLSFACYRRMFEDISASWNRKVLQSLTDAICGESEYPGLSLETAFLVSLQEASDDLQIETTELERSFFRKFQLALQGQEPAEPLIAPAVRAMRHPSLARAVMARILLECKTLASARGGQSPKLCSPRALDQPIERAAELVRGIAHGDDIWGRSLDLWALIECCTTDRPTLWPVGAGRQLDSFEAATVGELRAAEAVVRRSQRPATSLPDDELPPLDTRLTKYGQALEAQRNLSQLEASNLRALSRHPKTGPLVRLAFLRYFRKRFQ